MIDPSYKINSKKLRKLLANIRSNNHKIGLHPGFETWNSVDDLYKQKKNLEEINVNIDRNYPELNFLTNKINIDDKELLSLVPDGEKLLIYTSFENNLVIFLLGKNGYEIKIVRDRYDEIVANINKFRSLLQDPFSDIQSYKIAKIIYDDLIKPIQHMIEAKDKLVIINDEEISALPFASLIETNLMANEFSEEATEIPASWFSVLNSLFIILFAPVFSKIWASKYNPSGPVKFSIGLILLGLGFGFLAYGSMSIPYGAQTASVSIFWLVFAYLFHTLGELCVSPVGLSYVSKLAPVRLVGLMFGFWLLSSAIANSLGGLTGSYIDVISEQAGLSGFFLIFSLIPVGAGIVMFLLNGILKRKMHGFN